MNISVALKLLYYIIILLPVLITLKHLFMVIYNVKQQEEIANDNMFGFLWGLISIASYGVTVLFINKSMALSSFPMLDRFFYPFILVMLGMIYGVAIEDRNRFTASKAQALLTMPALSGMMYCIERFVK